MGLRLRQEEGLSVMKRVDLPANERHHPDSPDPTSAPIIMSHDKTPSPAPFVNFSFVRMSCFYGSTVSVRML